MVDLSPHGDGKLTDPEGHTWSIRRRRLDPRTARSMIRRSDVAVLVGEGGGGVLRWLADAERTSFAEEVRRCYWLPRAGSDSPISYTGHEFTDRAGKRLIYVETHC
jgi:hypothetical protein